MDQTQQTTLRLLAECFEELGGVPAVVLTDRMACLKAGIVANVGGAPPGLRALRRSLRLPARISVRAADPESKGVVEALVGYAQRDLLVPALTEGGFADLGAANAAARVWCAEVNGRVHSEIAAIPAERLVAERRALAAAALAAPATARRGAPEGGPPGDPLRLRALRGAERAGRTGGGGPSRGGQVVISQHGPRADPPRAGRAGRGGARGPYADRIAPAAAACGRARAAELAFLGSGPAAEAFLRAAAAAGTLRLERELRTDRRSWKWPGGETRSCMRWSARCASGGFKATDMRAILAAGSGVPPPGEPGAAPARAASSSRAPALGLCARGHRSGTMTATPPRLRRTWWPGLKRTQLAHFRPRQRRSCRPATTQRWSPEQLLRTLLSTEIAGRDAANQAARLKAGRLPGGARASRGSRSRSPRSPRRP